MTSRLQNVGVLHTICEVLSPKLTAGFRLTAFLRTVVKHGQAANERQTEPAPAGEAGNLATAELRTATFVRSLGWPLTECYCVLSAEAAFTAALALSEALRR